MESRTSTSKDEPENAEHHWQRRGYCRRCVRLLFVLLNIDFKIISVLVVNRIGSLIQEIRQNSRTVLTT